MEGKTCLHIDTACQSHSSVQPAWRPDCFRKCLWMTSSCLFQWSTRCPRNLNVPPKRRSSNLCIHQPLPFAAAAQAAPRRSHCRRNARRLLLMLYLRLPPRPRVTVSSGHLSFISRVPSFLRRQMSHPLSRSSLYSERK